MIVRNDTDATAPLRSIRSLGLIGNRHTVAAVADDAAIVWYCPGRFDRPSLFASLLDPEAGEWRVRLPGARPARRAYIGESAVLQTTLRSEAGEWTITDWMPLGAPGAICRLYSPAPAQANVEIVPRPNYGQRSPDCQRADDSVVIDTQHYLYASLPPRIADGRVCFEIPRGSSAWMVLVGRAIPRMEESLLARWREETLRAWEQLHQHTRYAGPYERALKDSLRALRLLTFESNGGIVAAATLGLPEVPGGERNYDYRYVWLRDAAMIVSALTRAGSDGVEERRFLAFLCDSAPKHRHSAPFPPFTTVDGERVPPPEALPWQGYRDSRPVLCGNGARDQLQLDGLGNVLLAAKLIYNRFHTREHWPVVRDVADFIAAHWQESDHGIWEEPAQCQYTASKVIAAVALRFIAEHADDEPQAQRWRRAARNIHAFIKRHCLTKDGAYAAVAGGDAVDVSAALFPVWDFCAPDSPEMLATIARLERDCSEDGLRYRRHLECFDARREGVFLAGTLWVAQYWIMRRDIRRAQCILQAVMSYANDLGCSPKRVNRRARRCSATFRKRSCMRRLSGCLST